MRTAIFVAMVGAVALAATPALSQSITLDPALGKPTRSVTVTGSGYVTGDAIVVTFGSDLACEATVEPVGTFSCAITVPATATPGMHQVTATRTADGTTAAATFRVRTNITQYLGGPRKLGFARHENVLNEHNIASVQPLWRVKLQEGDGIGQEGSSAVIVGDKLFVGISDGRLLSLWAKTGQIRAGWPKATGPIAYNARLWAANTPVYADGRVYIGGTDGKLHAYHVGNGTIPAGFPVDVAPGKIASSPPTYANGRIYIGFGYRDYYAVDVGPTPGVAWHLGVWPTTFAFAAPSVIDDKVYIAGETALFGVRAHDGSTLPGFPTIAGGYGAFNPAIVAAGNVYSFITPGSGGLNAITQADGSPVPGFPFAVAQPQGGFGYANGILYFSDDGGWLYAVRARNGELIWKTQQTSNFFSPCIFANGLLYCADSVIRASDGTFLRRLGVDLNWDVSVTINDGVIYAVDMFGVLTAFGLPSP